MNPNFMKREFYKHSQIFENKFFMFLAFVSFAVSTMKLITPNSPYQIQMGRNQVLIAKNPIYFKGKAYLSSSSSSVDVFGDTDYYIINFTSPGYIDVSTIIDRKFYYYIFDLEYCSSIDIIINPISKHYYGAKAKGYSTSYNINDTMVDNLRRCFWYIADSTYTVTLRTVDTESADKLSYSKGENGSYTSLFWNDEETLPDFSVLRVVWATDSSNVKGYAGFTMEMRYGSGDYLRPTTKNLKCISEDPSECTWYTIETLPTPKDDDDDDGLSLMVIMIICMACFFVFVFFVIGGFLLITNKFKLGASSETVNHEDASQNEQTNVPQQQQNAQPQAVYVAPVYVQPQAQYVQPQYGQAQQPFNGQIQQQPYIGESPNPHIQQQPYIAQSQQPQYYQQPVVSNQPNPYENIVQTNVIHDEKEI